jgi:thymidylate kinase
VFVEFVGAAGVGKSFLAERLHDELRKRGLVVRGVDTIRWKKGLKGLLVLASSAYLAALTQPSTLSRYLESTRRIALYKTRRQSCDGIAGFHIASDGIFHKMRALGRRSRSLDMIQIADRLFRYLAAPDVVIIVQASPATIFARRSARIRPRDEFTLESVRDDVAMTADTIRTVTHVQRQRAGAMQVIEVDLEQTGADSVALELGDRLEGMLDA